MNRRVALFVVLVVSLAGCTTSTKDNFTNPPAGPPDTCLATDALPRCTAGSLAYSCTSDRPDHTDTSLVCDDGTPGVGGATLFCCAPYGQWATECVPATQVPGCGAQSIGFACSGESTPDEADTSLVCSHAIAGDAGVNQYCCVSASQTSGACRCASYDADSGLCGVQSTRCNGATIGFDCVAGHAPTELNPALACDDADAGDGETVCCQTP